MGSLEAMKEGSRDRYMQDDIESTLKLVPEGIEGRVPFRGSLSGKPLPTHRGVEGRYGVRGLPDGGRVAQERPAFARTVTSAGLRESHVHDVIITKEAPNYWLD